MRLDPTDSKVSQITSKNETSHLTKASKQPLSSLLPLNLDKFIEKCSKKGLINIFVFYMSKEMEIKWGKIEW